MKALRPEIPQSQPQQFPILPSSRGHTLHTSEPVSNPEAHGLLSCSGTSARVIKRVDSPAGLWGACTSGAAGERYHRRQYLVTEAPSPQDPLRSRNALSSPREEGDSRNQ